MITLAILWLIHHDLVVRYLACDFQIKCVAPIGQSYEQICAVKWICPNE